MSEPRRCEGRSAQVNAKEGWSAATSATRGSGSSSQWRPSSSRPRDFRLTGAAQRVTRRHFVWLSEWADSPTELIYDRLRDDPTWEVRTWPIGHDVVGQGSDRLVELLQSIAASG